MQTDQPSGETGDNHTIENFINAFPVGFATFTYHGGSCLLYANEGFYSLMGRREGEFCFSFGVANALAFCPEDAYKIRREIERQIAEGVTFRVLYKPVTSVSRWVLLEARRKECKHTPESVYYGAFYDVTDLQESRLRYRLERDRYQAVSDISEELLFEFDIKTKKMLQTAPSAFSADIFYSGAQIQDYRNQILRRGIVHPQDVVTFIKMCEAFEQGVPEFDVELRSKSGDRGYIWCRVQGKTVYDEQGKPLKVIGKTINIDQQKKETEILRQQAKLDSLTGFYHKGAIEELVEAYLKHEGKEGNHALFIIDIDNFKAINDYLGHLFGDAVLSDIAAELRAMFMPKELVGRVGGDEFLVFLRKSGSLREIERTAEDICGIFRKAYVGEKNDYKISCSIGAALYPQHGQTYKALFRCADTALYAAKRAGKDVCRIYDPADVKLATQKSGGFLNEYQLERAVRKVKGKSRQQESIAIFELLFETKDLHSGIQMVLSMIGKRYGVGRAYIIEEAETGLLNKITYEWCNGGIMPRTAFTGETPYHVTRAGRPYYLKDVDTLREFPVYCAYLRENGIKSMLRYTIYENGVFSGLIGFDECRQSRDWTEEEVDSLTLAAKFIGSFLVKRHAQNEIEKLAYTDSLTGLWNLNKFKLEAQPVISLANEEKAQCALICFDVEKFRYINDTFGFDIGDDIIRFIARAVQKMAAKTTLFSRITADKFVILLRYQTVAQLMAAVDRLHNKIKYFIHPVTGRYKLNYNFGIYLFQQADREINAALDKADMARRKANGSHASQFVFYNDAFRLSALREKEMEDMAEQALGNGEFLIYYQPKVDLQSNKISGAEALVRWDSPVKGFLQPNQFIPLFEKNGFIGKLDFYVFEKVYQLLRSWIDQGKPVVPIAVNFSRIHLSDREFIIHLIDLSRKYNIPNDFIEIELTESMFMKNVENLIQVMQKLKSLGFIISIDDFGSGYSSLRLLRDLPVDFLKLDKEFLHNGEENEREQIVIRNIIRMAKQLGIKVVSEGVESETQARFLKECGCDLAQGFLYARPMPVENFEALLQEKDMKLKL